MEACLDDVAAHAGAARVLVVHGGGAEVDRLARELGLPPRHATSASGVRSRLTDAPALDVLTMALAGRVKPRLVAGLQRRGVPAAGLTGMDGATLRACPKVLKVRDGGGRVRVVRDDLSGRVDGVETPLLAGLLEAGVVPVLSPPALGPDGPLNVDADRVAAATAGALGAAELVFLSDVPGVLGDPADPSTRIPLADPADLARDASIGGGMRQKALAAQLAIAGGVPRVVIADGTRPDPLRAAREGDGTVVEPRAAKVGGRTVGG